MATRNSIASYVCDNIYVHSQLTRFPSPEKDVHRQLTRATRPGRDGMGVALKRRFLVALKWGWGLAARGPVTVLSLPYS